MKMKMIQLLDIWYEDCLTNYRVDSMAIQWRSTRNNNTSIT